MFGSAMISSKWSIYQSKNWQTNEIVFTFERTNHFRPLDCRAEVNIFYCQYARPNFPAHLVSSWLTFKAFRIVYLPAPWPPFLRPTNVTLLMHLHEAPSSLRMQIRDPGPEFSPAFPADETCSTKKKNRKRKPKKCELEKAQHEKWKAKQ